MPVINRAIRKAFGRKYDKNEVQEVEENESEEEDASEFD